MSTFLAIAGLVLLGTTLRGSRDGDASPPSSSDATTASSPPAADDFYNRAPAGFHGLDANGVIIEINDVELELLQRSRAEVVGRCRFIDLLGPISKQRFLREFPTFKKVGRVDGLSFDLVRKDGSTVPILLSATAIYDAHGAFVRSRSVMLIDSQRARSEESLQGAYTALEGKVEERTVELTAVIAALREEIDERERTQELLRQSEERAVAVIAAAIDGVLTLDENGFIETANPAIERIFDRREADLVGRSVKLLIPEEDVAAYGDPAPPDGGSGARAILGNKREMIGRRRDGSSLPLEIAITEMDFGSRRLLLGTIRDLTEQKRAEEHLVRLQAELRRTEMLAAIGSLVAGFAHEARNPLFGISAVLDALAARFEGNADFTEHFTLLRRDVKRLNDLMQDLLEFGRPGSELKLRTIAPVLSEAAAECAALARSAEVAIESRLDSRDCAIAMNARLVRAFQNLLQNAIQFSPRGSTVTLASTRANGWVECSVRDRGPGLAVSDLPHLFEPFFTRRRGGTGLGLAIVQRIIEEHRGTITAANHADGGAVISVRLPVAAV